LNSNNNIKNISFSLFLFFAAGLCEIGGGYLVWLWLREAMSWILGIIGGFVLFVYRIIPTFQPSYFHRIYAAYGGIFIIMAIAWGWIFERIVPDVFDVIGAVIAIVGVVVIFYMPRKGAGEKSIWSRQQ
jgi:small multidrug resistance family-3 protein